MPSRQISATKGIKYHGESEVATYASSSCFCFPELPVSQPAHEHDGYIVGFYCFLLLYVVRSVIVIL